MSERAEEDRIAGGAIVRVGLFVFAVLALALGGLAWLSHHFTAEHPTTALVYPVPPKPRIDPLPQGELERYRAQQESRLKSYAWVDRRQGLVHIPIERAMELYAKSAKKGDAR